MRSQEEKRKAEEPPGWIIDEIADSTTGRTYWPSYVPSYYLGHLGSLLARREALDYALKEIQEEETKSKIEKILEKVIKAQYWEEEAFGGHRHEEGSRAHLQATIRAAKSTLKKMEDHLEKDYDYGQLGMRQIIRDRIEGIKSILEIKKKRKDASDISAAIEYTVSQIAQFKGKGIKNSDQIGQILLAAGLFRGIRCQYDDTLRLWPRITKDGLKIEEIPDNEQSDWRTPECQNLALDASKSPACVYHRTKGYCGKATERVERILSINI